jgi:hypothetical protein
MVIAFSQLTTPFFVATKPPPSLECKLDTIMLLGGFNTPNFHIDIGLPITNFHFYSKFK